MHAVLSLLNVRRGQIFAIAAVVTALGAIVNVLLPREYSAQASLVVDSRSPELPGVAPYGPLPVAASWLATQVDIVRSRAVAARVLGAMKPDTRAYFEDLYRRADSPAAFEQWAETALLKRLVVTPSRESNVVTVNFRSGNPAVSAEIANGFVGQYLNTAVDLRSQRAQRYNELYETEAAGARERLQAARDRLAAFRKSNNISVDDEKLDAETTRLTDLNKELVTLQARRADTANRARQAKSKPERISELMNDPMLIDMRAELDRARNSLRELEQQFGPSHPKILEARAAVTDLTKRVRDETARLVQSIDATDANTEQRVNAIKTAIEQQKEVVATLQAARSSAALLTADVDNAQAAVNAIVKGTNQTRLESRSSQGGASVLEVAQPPIEASSPKVLRNMFLASFAGCLLGIGWAFWRESKNGMLRSEAQLAGLIGGSPLVLIPEFQRANLLRFDPRRSLGRLPQRQLLSLAGAGKKLRGRGAGGRPEPSDALVADTIMVESSPTQVPVRTIGQELNSAGLLDDKEIGRIVDYQEKHGGLFGEAAVALRLVSRDDVVAAVSRQFDYPYADQQQPTEVHDELVMANAPFSDRVECFRNLRSELMFGVLKSDGVNPRQALALISPNLGDGKTYVIANLAVAFSQARLRTLLVDADLRSARLHHVFGIENKLGLSNILSGRRGERPVQPVSYLRDLYLLPAGSPPPNPTELLNQPQFALLLHKLARKFDVVLVDTPAAAHGSDSIVVAFACGAALTVTRKDNTGDESLRKLLAKIDKLGIRHAGVLLNRA